MFQGASVNLSSSCLYFPPAPIKKRVISSKNWSCYGFCSELQPAKELVYCMCHCSHPGGSLRGGENYSESWAVCIRPDSIKIAGCLNADEFMKDIYLFFKLHWVLRNVPVSLEWLAFTSSSENNIVFFIYTCMRTNTTFENHF